MAQQQKYNKLADKHVLIIGGTSGNPLLFPNSIQEHEADRDGKGIGYGVAEALIESSANITISSSSPTASRPPSHPSKTHTLQPRPPSKDSPVTYQSPRWSKTSKPSSRKQEK
jgi:NAD(P)-dependent dehydrogenase (short-subunit alcohol dehydrogenase family)